MGAIDPIQMTQQAPNQEVLYLSGWACSSLLTSTNEVSPDFGDYPYNTVPNQVERLFNAQQLHDRRHMDERLNMTKKQRQATAEIDYLRPIIADGDTGHGGLTAVMKLAKLFAQKGAAAVHFEDQLHGGKKCGHLAGKVLVPMGQHVDRLVAARYQWDLMGTENLVIARSDAESGKLLSSDVDIRDHEFIKGVTEEMIPLAEEIQILEMKGATSADIDVFEADWAQRHQLKTFDESIIEKLQSNSAQESKIQPYLDAVQTLQNPSLRSRAKLATEHGIELPFFSWDIPRTKEGFYHYSAGMPAATKRALTYAPYADLLWAETGSPNLDVAAALSSTVRAKFPGKIFVYNLSPSFNWSAAGFSDEALKSFIWDLAKLGFTLQLVSLAGLHSTALASHRLSKAFREEGMLAYVRMVQEQERREGVDVLMHQKWSGAAYMDGVVAAVQSGNSGSRALGQGNTEAAF